MVLKWKRCTMAGGLLLAAALLAALVLFRQDQEDPPIAPPARETGSSVKRGAASAPGARPVRPPTRAAVPSQSIELHLVPREAPDLHYLLIGTGPLLAGVRLVRRPETLRIRLPAVADQPMEEPYTVLAVRSADRAILAIDRGVLHVPVSPQQGKTVRQQLRLDPPLTSLEIRAEDPSGAALAGQVIELRLLWGSQGGNVDVRRFGPAHGLLDFALLRGLKEQGYLASHFRDIRVTTDAQGRADVSQLPAPCEVVFRSFRPPHPDPSLRAITTSLIESRGDEPLWMQTYLADRAGVPHHAVLTLAHAPRFELGLPDVPLGEGWVAQTYAWLTQDGQEKPLWGVTIGTPRERTLSAAVTGLPASGLPRGLHLHVVVVGNGLRNEDHIVRTYRWPVRSLADLHRTVRVVPGAGRSLMGSVRHTGGARVSKLIIESSLGFHLYVETDEAGRFRVPDIGFATPTDQAQRFAIFRVYDHRRDRIKLARPIPLVLGGANQIVIE